MIHIRVKIHRIQMHWGKNWGKRIFKTLYWNKVNKIKMRQSSVRLEYAIITLLKEILSQISKEKSYK